MKYASHMIQGFIILHIAVKLQYFVKNDIINGKWKMVVYELRENKLADLSMDFAVEVLDMTDGIKGHYSLVNQIERSATSIGANIREANYAHGKPDFIAKMQIALKECYETEYLLELFKRSKILNESKAKELTDKCGTIRRILVASINTTKSNMQK